MKLRNLKILNILSILAAALISTCTLVAQKAPPPPAWIARSNSFTQKLLDIEIKYSPEEASRQGLTKFDTKASQPTLANELAERKEKEALLAKLIAARDAEKDPNVAQDLTILIQHLQLEFKAQDFRLNNMVPYIDIVEYVYRGLQPLLDDQVPNGRHHAAIERLDRYVGIDPDPMGGGLGETPGMSHGAGVTTANGGNAPGGNNQTTTNNMGNSGMSAAMNPNTLYGQVMQRIIQQAAKPDMIWPSRDEILTERARDGEMLDGIKKLFEKYKLGGNWEIAYGVFQRQVNYYDNWIRTSVLPHARTDFRMPPSEYELALQDYGVDIPPAELTAKAHAAFTDIQAQMKPIAAQIAKQRNLPSSDYRDVIRELKKQQLSGDVLAFYENRLHDIEGIITKQGLVTLPNRPAIIRIGTPAESAQQPAPHMVPPPFLNNTGQRGVFVLPLTMPASAGSATAAQVDDYTFDAATWTLIAHEARPGHELQFDSMVEHGVSTARVLYAFNSTNVEGWGLYAEYITLPYMPLEGQLISLQFRLMRAARAFLDPGLQDGTYKPADAMKVLTQDVCLSVPFANEEVERYTFRSPGQANSYFYGFTRLLELRKATEATLGAKFDQHRYHDFILAQGLLPPDLMKKAVETNFIPDEQKR